MQLEQIIKEKVEQFEEVGRQGLYDRILERINKGGMVQDLSVQDLFHLSRQEYQGRQRELNEVGLMSMSYIEQSQQRLLAKEVQIHSKTLQYQRYQDWRMQSEQNLLGLEQALEETQKMSTELQEELSLVQSEGRYLQYLQQQQQLQRRQSKKVDKQCDNSEQLTKKQEMEEQIKHLRLVLKCKQEQLYQSDQRRLDVTTRLKEQWVRIQQNEARVKQMQENISCIQHQNTEMKDEIKQLQAKLEKRVCLTTLWSPKSLDGTKVFIKYSYEDRNTKTVRKCMSILGKGQIDYECKETVRQFDVENYQQPQIVQNQKTSVLNESRMKIDTTKEDLESEYLALKKTISYELPTMDTDMSRISHMIQDGMSSFDLQSPNPSTTTNYFKAVKKQQILLCKCRKPLICEIYCGGRRIFEWLADRVVKQRIRNALRRFRPQINY